MPWTETLDKNTMNSQVRQKYHEQVSQKYHEHKS